LGTDRVMARRVGDGPFPPVLAGVPTVTDVSRAAFFAGKSMPAGKDHRTTDDPDRWQKHSGLKRLLPGAQGPRLFLGTEGHLRDGSLAPAVREHIERKNERVVALVLNAIDESLKSDPQQEHTWNVESIRSLSHLLDAARASGRVVVLASDHGHVAGDQLHRPDKVNREDSSRWRHLDAAGFDANHEVAFTGEHVWYDRGKQGVVLLADDQHSYSSRRTWGAHGGATLAEVVAPFLVIGWEGMDREVPEDDASRVYALRHVHRPSWWYLDIRPTDDAEGRRGKAKPTRGKARPEPETSGKLLLPGLILPEPPKAPEPAPPENKASPPAPASARPAESDASLSPLTLKLSKSGDFKALAGASKYRDQVLQAVDFLARRQGVAPTSAFADALGIPGWRVTQTIARYTELLNLDGEPILQVDLRAQQVRLDITRLTAAFGLEK
jgi:nicotinamidase-related amidase